MSLFRRRPIATGGFRITGVTRLDGVGTLILGGVPQEKLHVTGLVEVAGEPPEAAAVDVHLGTGQAPAAGVVLPVEVVHRDPLRIRVAWGGSADQQQIHVAQQDATAQVIADLAAGGRLQHAPGASDPLGIAFTAPEAVDTIAEQLAATMGTPISVDVTADGSNRHLAVNRGGHLSSAEAAELLRTGTAATATIRAATRVPVPQTMMPGPEASLWDLDLQVHRSDGTDYDTATRVGFRTEARRGILGEPGLTIPVRIDPQDDARVAVDGTTFDADHPGAPAG